MSIEPAILKYLGSYGPAVQARVRELIAQDLVDGYIRDRYGKAHEVRNDKALRRMAIELKDCFMRNSVPLGKVVYDSRLQALSQALGTHTAVSRVQGSRLKASREIRVAAVFRDAPADFLKMILVHELAHLKERDHNKAFYQLCTHMAPDYHQLEFDLRLYLTVLECRPSQACAAPPQHSGPDPKVAGMASGIPRPEAGPGSGECPHAL